MRKRFLTVLGASLLVTVLILFGIALGRSQPSANLTLDNLQGGVQNMMAAVSNRSYVSGNYMFELDGVQTGFIKSVGGGNIYAEVISEPVGPDYIVRKHVGAPKYEEFELKIGFSMAKGVYDWIKASWSANYQRKAGAIIAADYNMNAKSKREFFEALITATTIPAMDGSSKEPGYITVKFAPEWVRNAKATEQKVGGNSSKSDAQKTWLPANFRLDIPGLDTSKVSKIDSFTIRNAAVQDNVGDARDQQREPGKLEFPNLKITLPVANADTWVAWHEDFVIKGNNDQAKEKSGTLTLLSANRQEVLATIRFFNMGIISIKETVAESGSDTIQRYEIELYVERMEFDGPATVK